MVKEQLTLHQVEGEVVQSPAEHRGTDFVVESLEGGVLVIATASLPSENSNALEENPDDNGDGGCPPDDRVTKEVDLSVVLTPEVDTALEQRPRLRSRLPGVRVSQASVGLPHDLVQLPELAEETRVSVVDLFGILPELGMLVVLDVPQAVGHATLAGAGNFLLLRGPIRKLDLVGEESATSHDVNEAELGLNSANTLLGDGALGLFLDDLDTEEIVGITIEPFITIRGNLVLPLSLADRGTNIVRVQTAVGRLVVQSDSSAVLEVRKLSEAVPGVGSVDGKSVNIEGLSLVLEQPNVVLVLVRVESDLLLLTSSGVHQSVRVKISSLSVDVADGNTATKENIGGNILHALAVESSLELGAHETISLTRVGEAEEVDSEHGHVEGDGNDDETEDASHEVLGPKAESDVLVVSEQNPQLNQSQSSDPGDGEETNPFDTSSNTQSETTHGQPEPPSGREGLGGANFMLVREAREGEGGESGSGDERRIEKDQSSLSEETVF